MSEPSATPVRLSALQWRVFAVSFLIIFVEGFDAQIMAFIARTLATDWNLGAAAVTQMFVASILGAVIGGLTAGLGDIVGRKRLLVVAVLSISALTLAAAFVRTPEMMVGLRFATGVFIGASIPNVFALSSDFSPPERRGAIITTVSCGLAVGGAVGGVVSGALLALYGWQSCFIVAGLMTLAVAPFAIFTLTGAPSAFQPNTAAAADTRKPIKAILGVRLVTGALCIFGVSIFGLTVLQFLLSWTPWMLSEAGLPVDEAAHGSVWLNIGGIAGTLLIGRLMDRFNPMLVIGLSLGVGYCAVALAANVLQSQFATLALMFVIGWTLVGGTLGLNAFASGFFPREIRSIGLGMNYLSGRLGGVFGPILGGALIGAGLTTATIFPIGALPLLLAIVLVGSLAVLTRRTASN